MVPTRYDATFKLARLTDRTLGYLLDALTEIDCEQLETFKEIPLLYESGVRYYHDNRDDPWMDTLSVLAAHERSKRTGIPEVIDCEDLVCWRVAELRTRFGVKNARPVFKRMRVTMSDGPKQMVHILVEANGQIEDPSRILGMGRPSPRGLFQVFK